MTSPSKIPQSTATIGIRYVTDDENIVPVFLTKRLKSITERAVPPIARIETYPKLCQKSGCRVVVSKSVNNK